jgi:catechol 2,3-dioxygenase-like lactoylglutathione lyase family enzyme
MVRFEGIHHLALATGDMDKTVRFWRDLLGMRIVAGLGGRGHKQYFLEIAPGHYIVFFEWPGVAPVEEKDHGFPVSGPFIFDHVAFAVDSAESLWELKDRLEAAGFWVSDAIDHGIIHSIYSFDPNGIPIEFSVKVEGCDPGSTPVMADSHASGVVLEGPDPVPGIWPPVTSPTPPEERDIFPGEGLELVDGQKKNLFEKFPGGGARGQGKGEKD